MYPAEAANSRPNLETIMAHILHLQQRTTERAFDRVSTTLRAIAHAVAAEHTRALRAATKAASPHQRLNEVRALYGLPLDPHQQSNVVAQADSLDKI
jgi:hypothetical protein